MQKKDVRWSCSAMLDLLGFSNHLMTTNLDIRTSIGAQAIERLNILEKSIQLFEQEKEKYPDLYPKELHYRRFNDALFIGIDAEYLAPPTGQITLTGGYNIEQLKKLVPEKGKLVKQGTTWESGSDVAKLLGLVARIHNYVNKEEAKKSFPGCRTIVTTGLRKCFTDSKGRDDFFSANFSTSMAFEVSKYGGSTGIKGNNLYVEDDVATAISYCEPCDAILGFSQFISKDTYFTPYQHVPIDTVSLNTPSWTTNETIQIEIMKRHLVFRCLNTNVLENLQIYQDYENIGEKATDSLDKNIKLSLSSNTPSLEEINKSTISGLFFDTKNFLKYPFLSLRFSLEADYMKLFGDKSIDN